MLALSLEHLSRTNQLHSDVRIFADTPANLDEIERVRDQYYPDALIFHAKPHLAVPSGCWNILTSIKEGYKTGADFVFLIEEDVFVWPEFFDWHLAQYGENNGEIVASCGRTHAGFHREFPGIYTNPGACLSHPLLERLVPHINDDFFRGLRAYMDKHFEPWDEQSDLDDGLIRRVIREMGGKVAYPASPVALHKGWHFYNAVDIYKNDGTIDERVAGLRKMLERIIPGERYARDLEF